MGVGNFKLMYDSTNHMDFLTIDHWRAQINDQVVISDKDLAWIDHKLSEVNQTGSRIDQARAIQQFISSSFQFGPYRFKTISSIRENGHGNCYDHAMMAIIFLRRAGIPAKFVRELQLYRRNEEEWKEADYMTDSHWLFGAFHNDHTWVLFEDDQRIWQPLDSSMRYTGIEEFYKVRTKGFAPIATQLMSSPFAIWSAEDDEFNKMTNISQQIWDGFAPPEYWENLVTAFTDLSFDMTHNEPLSVDKREKLKQAALIYFQNPDFT